jgi:ElaB/YqjD/DUF883 family membrane-anchored ribosome-binding protein
LRRRLDAHQGETCSFSQQEHSIRAYVVRQKIDNEELPMSSADGEDAMKNMTDKATYERLQKDVEAVKNDISALTEQLSDALNAFTRSTQKQARRTYKQTRADVDTFVDDASKKGAAALEAAQDAAATLEETIEDAIVQRPLASIGLAIGLGFLIGVTWRR